MARKISSQQLRVLCEFEKLFPNEKIYSDYLYSFDNAKDKKIEFDIFIPNFFELDIHLFFENDGFRWHKEKRDKDLEKTNLVINEGHYIFRTIDDRLKKLIDDENEILYSQNKNYNQKFKPVVMSLFKSILNILKLHKNCDKKITILQNYLLENKFINCEKYNDYIKNKKIPNSVGEIDPGCISEFSDKNILSAYQISRSHREGIIWNCIKCSHEYQKTYIQYKEYGCPKCLFIFRQNESISKLKKIFNKLMNGNELSDPDKNFLSDKRKAKFGGEYIDFGAFRSKSGNCFYISDQELAESYDNVLIKNIFNQKDNEKDSNDLTRDVCYFKLQYDCFPCSRGNDYEKKLNNFRNRKLSILKNGIADEQGNLVWQTGILYKSDIDISIKLGVNDCFRNADSDEHLENEAALSICDFFHKYSRRPFQNSSDNYEAKLGRKLQSLRKIINKAKSSKGELFDSTIDIFKKNGLLYLILPTNDRKIIEVESFMKDLISFIKEFGRLPKQTGSTSREKKLANKLNKLRQIKAGKLKGEFNPYYQELAEKNNLKLLFDQGFVLS